LPFGLSLENLKSDHNSRPRNPIIANACFFAGYIDTWGRGTLKIINACKEAGLSEPEIKEMNGRVEVTIFLETIDDAGGQEGGPISSTIGGKIGRATEGKFLLVRFFR
jgi:ATP-dependent DNA helicase RecG